MKKMVMLGLVLVLVFSVFAVDETLSSEFNEKYCVGFWNKLNCVLFGSEERKPLVGKGIFGTSNKPAATGQAQATGSSGSVKLTNEQKSKVSELTAPQLKELEEKGKVEEAGFIYEVNKEGLLVMKMKENNQVVQVYTKKGKSGATVEQGRILQNSPSVFTYKSPTTRGDVALKNPTIVKHGTKEYLSYSTDSGIQVLLDPKTKKVVYVRSEASKGKFTKPKKEGEGVVAIESAFKKAIDKAKPAPVASPAPVTTGTTQQSTAPYVSKTPEKFVEEYYDTKYKELISKEKKQEGVVDNLEKAVQTVHRKREKWEKDKIAKHTATVEQLRTLKSKALGEGASEDELEKYDEKIKSELEERGKTHSYSVTKFKEELEKARDAVTKAKKERQDYNEKAKAIREKKWKSVKKVKTELSKVYSDLKGLEEDLVRKKSEIDDSKNRNNPKVLSTLQKQKEELEKKIKEKKETIKDTLESAVKSAGGTGEDASKYLQKKVTESAKTKSAAVKSKPADKKIDYASVQKKIAKTIPKSIKKDTWQYDEFSAKVWKQAAKERATWMKTYERWEKDLKSKKTDKVLEEMKKRPSFTKQYNKELKAINDETDETQKTKKTLALVTQVKAQRNKEIEQMNTIAARYEKEKANKYYEGKLGTDLKSGTTKDVLTLLGAPLGTFQKLGKYQGLSNLIAPDMTNEWMDWSEQAVGAAMDAVGYLSKEWCDYADLQTHENANGENYVFVEDQSGNKQFVGRIQAEVSDSKTFLMCHPVNKTCPNNYYCKNTLCYKDEFATTPEKGYLHKIEWGVTAPQDSKATPFVDENNKAVKFNVMLSYKGIETPLYLRSNYNKYEVIQLTNGESDKGIVLMYLGDIADKACVKFSDTAYPTDRYGKGRVNEICANIVGIAKTGVDFTDTDAGSTPSFTVQGGKVSQNSNLW